MMRHDNRGFTLVELMVVTVLGMVILGAVYQTLSTQQRTYQHQSAVIDTHEATRTALEVLAGELRESSSTGMDILMAQPESVTVRALRKMGLACYVPPTGLGLYIDTWTMGPDFAAGDRLLAYDNGGTPDDPADDFWRALEVASADNSGYNLAGCSDWAEYSLTGSHVGNYTRQRVLVTGGLLGTIARGAPVRSYEAITYAIQQVDGQWMLTRREGAAGAVVPLVGPLASPAESGLRLSYFNAAGTQIATGSLGSSLGAINSFRIQVKATLPAGRGDTVVQDMGVSIYLRNNDPTAMGW